MKLWTTQEERALERLRCAPVPFRFAGSTLQRDGFVRLEKRGVARFVRDGLFVGYRLKEETTDATRLP